MHFACNVGRIRAHEHATAKSAGDEHAADRRTNYGPFPSAQTVQHSATLSCVRRSKRQERALIFQKKHDAMRAVTKSFCPVLVLTIGLPLTAQVALAQVNAGAKASGQYNFYGNSAHSSFHSARQNVGHYSQYLNSVQTPVAQPAVVADRPATVATPAGVVDRDVAEEASDTIESHIDKLGRYLGKMRKHAEAIEDVESLKIINDVERNLAEAKTHHEALDEHHAGEKIDAKTARQHCDKINAALAKAHAEHDKLMKRLGDENTK